MWQVCEVLESVGLVLHYGRELENRCERRRGTKIFHSLNASNGNTRGSCTLDLAMKTTRKRHTWKTAIKDKDVTYISILLTDGMSGKPYKKLI